MPRKGDQIAGSDTQMAAFLFGLARGATVAEAAAGAGMKVTTLYDRRKRCPVFARVWREAAAMAGDADAEARREERAGADGGAGTVIRGQPGRTLIQRRKRPVEFDRERKQALLDHFAATCNLEASAVAAGVSLTTVYRALKNDEAFREGFEEALRLGYLCLEAEAVRQQREAQAAYRLDPGDKAAKAQSFERTMQLLREYKRAAGGTVGRRADRSRGRWTFEATIEAIEAGLKAFGVAVPEAGAEDPQGPLHRAPPGPPPRPGEEYPDG